MLEMFRLEPETSYYHRRLVVDTNAELAGLRNTFLVLLSGTGSFGHE